MSRNGGSVQVSPVLGRTRKIFVGGLASSVTESDFKAYFEQFGSITDVVVMYDQNTQRPRGFGFITFDSEDSVDEVLTKTFHELNGKMVEVKRAVPRELSPAPNRSPLSGFNYGMSKVDLLGGYNPIYSQTMMGGLGFAMDSRFSPLSGGRGGLSPFASGYGMGMNYEPAMNGNSIGNGNFNSNLSYERALNPYIIGSNRFGNNLGGSNIGNNQLLSSVTRNLWDNGGLNLGAPTDSRNSSVFMGSGSNCIGGNTNGIGWDSSQISAHGTGRANFPSVCSGSIGYGIVDNNHSLSAESFGRNFGTNAAPNSSHRSPNIGYGEGLTGLYTGESVIGDSTWQFGSSNRDGYYSSIDDSVSASSGVAVKGASGYVGSYSVASRQTNNGKPLVTLFLSSTIIIFTIKY